jgi:hypothetical protein
MRVVEQVMKNDVAPMAAVSRKHDSMREGAALGLVVATSTWLWVAGVDAIAGDPFRTFTALGGIAAFTVTHYLLNLAYGVVIVSGIHGTEREPSLMMAVVFGCLMIEIAFAFLAAVLSNFGLGDLVWLRIFVGSLIGASVALVFLARRHRLGAQLRAAR